MQYRLLLFCFILSNFISCIDEHNANVEEISTTAPSETNEPLDSVLKQELEWMSVEDQTLRLLLPDALEKFGVATNEYKYIWTLINRQDSICAEKITDILEEHGWLGKSRVGEKANQAIWLIIQHAELEAQEKYLPLLETSVEQGESEGWHLAFLKDRILMYKEEKQIYGTQAVWDNTIKKNIIHPIENVEQVNERRASLGLEPIEEYVEANGYVFEQL